jgi:hypothetical protein
MSMRLLRRQKPVRLALVVAFVFLCYRCWADRDFTITFEGPPTQPPHSGILISSYYEAYMGFVQEDSVYYTRRNPAGAPGWPDNGTTYIAPAPWPVTCTRVDGAAFRLLSVDLAGYSDVVPDFPASFEGHCSDGSVVTTNFAVSGIVFQRYYFGPEFSDLTNVLVTAGALDNFTTRVRSISPVLKITHYSYGTNMGVTLQAQGRAGFLYRLESGENPATTNWTPLTTFEWSYYSTTLFTTNSPACRFFRVVELP